MAFHDVRLPEDVEQGATGGPSFHTTVLGMSSGHEQRNIDWSDSRADWELSYGIQNKRDFALCRAFFFARRGQAYGFRFKDWSDYELVSEPIGVGDGVNAQFQIICTYEEDGPEPYTRRITRPVAGTVTVQVDSVNVPFTLEALGIVVVTTPPADGKLVTVSCEFDVPVRFNVDKFALELDQANAGTIGSLPVIELRE